MEPHCPHCPVSADSWCVGHCDWAASGEEAKRELIRYRSQFPPPEVGAVASTPSAAASAVPLAGDLVALLAARVGADRLAKWAEETFGVECGCPERQALFNRWDAKLRRRFGLTAPPGAPVAHPHRAD